MRRASALDQGVPTHDLQRAFPFQRQPFQSLQPLFLELEELEQLVLAPLQLVRRTPVAPLQRRRRLAPLIQSLVPRRRFAPLVRQPRLSSLVAQRRFAPLDRQPRLSPLVARRRFAPLDRQPRLSPFVSQHRLAPLLR